MSDADSTGGPVEPGPAAAAGPAPAGAEPRFLRVLDAIAARTTTVLTVALCALLALMCLVTVLQVFCRYVLGTALFWPEELSRACLVWITFLGAAIGVQQGTHIAITAIYDRFPKRLQALANVVSALVIAWVGVELLRLGWSVAVVMGSGQSVSLGISVFWFRLALPVGGVGILIGVLPLLARAAIGVVRPDRVRAVTLGSGEGVA